MSTPVPPPDAGDVRDVGTNPYREIQQTEEFQHLRRSFRGFVFPMTAFFLIWYFAYVLLADFAHGFMSRKVVSNINVGLVLGLLQFVTTFAITIWYIRWANKKFDPAAAEIREKFQAGETR